MNFIFHIKKSLATFIISLLLINSSGYILLYISSLHFVKKHIIEAIDRNEYDEEIFLLTLSKKDISEGKISFKWLDSREFRYNGKMYDIKKNISDEDSIRVYCYYDEKEHIIESLFNFYSEKRSNDNKNSNNISLVFFLSLFLSKNISVDSELVFLGELKTHNKHEFSNFISDVLTPPPQI
ncbi:hypothetical protein [Ignavibacterium sp.]|uniref:hypothetical protein n=1 Tax=Ignavibacterium sp. TaxID=2651167 RepID=UPI00307D156C